MNISCQIFVFPADNVPMSAGGKNSLSKMLIANSHQYVKIYGYFLSDICISCGQCPHVRGEKNSLAIEVSCQTKLVP